MSKWNIRIFMPTNVLHTQTRENSNLPWFLWRRRWAVRGNQSKNSQLIIFSNIAAEAPTQCLQRERATRVKHPLQKKII